MYLLYLILTLLHILAACLFYVSWNKKLDLFDPFYLISGLYIIIFVYAPFIWIINSKIEYQGIEVMSQLPTATIVFNLGYLSYVLGAFAINENNANMKVEFVSNGIDYQNKVVKELIIKYAVNIFIFSMLLSTLYYVLVGRSILSLLTLGQSGVTFYKRRGEGIYFLKCFYRSAIPASLLLITYSEKKILAWLGAILLADVCISTGSRNLAITVFLSFVVFNYIKNNRRPRCITVVIWIVVFYLFLGFVGIYRNDMKNSREIDLAVINSNELFRSFMYNAEIFFPFYNLVEYVPKYSPYHYGLGILNIFVQFIPRILWKGKPIMLGKTGLEAIYGNGMGGAAYPNIGEYYYEFGIVGVIIFMFVTGYLMRKFYLRILEKNNDDLNLILFSMHYGYIIQFICRGHFASWAIDYFFMFIPIIFLRKILIKKKYTNG